VIRVKWIGTSSEPRVYALVVPEPARFTTGAFARALGDIGIVVEGRTGRFDTGERGEVASPPPLAELVGVMNRESINLYAELIFRNAARLASPLGVGSASMGNALLRDFIELRVGASPTDVYAADGSGLSTLDRVTARSLVKLLSYAHSAPWSRQFHESLPVAGREETLRLRMRQTPAQGNLHAKTGTTNDVVALSGYVAARTGEIRPSHSSQRQGSLERARHHRRHGRHPRRLRTITDSGLRLEVEAEEVERSGSSVTVP
jgi:D-alanyl-D-alanine carboxypeptidase/D-alanyl-D-alanine-endopeptidase (penicillin-binding protein 4)